MIIFLRFGVMVSSHNPLYMLYAKLTMFAKLNYMISCCHIRPNKPLRVNQQVINHKREAFSTFLLVAERERV